MNFGTCQKGHLNDGVPRSVRQCHRSRSSKILGSGRRCREREFLKHAVGMLMRTRARGTVHKLAREMAASSKAMDHSQSCNCKKSHHQRNYYTAY